MSTDRMAPRFDHFVILADMRTGSNLLEESLNAYPGLTCHGEVFNPRFVGHAEQTALLGTTISERDRDPLALVARIIGQSEGLGGFRLFPGHDPRVLDHCLRTPSCAKVVLARNPVDSYVSLGIARQTGQWWLGAGGAARTARVRFDRAEFEGFLKRLQDFYGRIRHALQTTGQTAFHIHYDDLADPAVLDGLARWLGATEPARPGAPRGRVQNPEPLEEKVENFPEMVEALGRADLFDLYRVPDFEPRRGPNIPGWMTSDTLRLLYMPLAGGPTDRVAAWLAAAGGAPPATGATRKDMRLWKRDTPGHRSFTVVSHPLARVHDVFCARILRPGPDGFAEIRRHLAERHGLPLPAGEPGPDYAVARHRAAFLGFLRFVKANLGGQTAVRVPSAWASQAGLVRALSDVAAPDAILRAETLAQDLARLAPEAPPPPPPVETAPWPLAAVWDAEVEEAARAAYQRDYTAFGYGPWR